MFTHMYVYIYIYIYICIGGQPARGAEAHAAGPAACFAVIGAREGDWYGGLRSEFGCRCVSSIGEQQHKTNTYKSTTMAIKLF